VPFQSISTLERRADFATVGAVVDTVQPMTVLLVEDDAELARDLTAFLSASGWRVVIAHDGHRALIEARRERVDVVVLDTVLPGRSGLDVCRAIRLQSDVPILFLSEHGEEADRVIAFELGADDYVAKPCSKPELRARLHALVRRSRTIRRPRQLVEAGPLVVDVERRVVTRDEKLLPLTTRDFVLLQIFIERRGRVLSRAQLLQLVHGGREDVDARAIDVAVYRLRQKIEDQEGELLQTVRGLGYVFLPDG
jgi:two-component system, OmpR family, response regulator